MSANLREPDPQLAQVAASVLGICPAIAQALKRARRTPSVGDAPVRLDIWTEALNRAAQERTVTVVHTADAFRLRCEVLDALGGAAEFLKAVDEANASIAIGTLVAAALASVKFRLTAQAAVGGTLHDQRASALLTTLNSDLSAAEFRHDRLWLMRAVRDPLAIVSWLESSTDAHDRSLAAALSFLAERVALN